MEKLNTKKILKALSILGTIIVSVTDILLKKR